MKGGRSLNGQEEIVNEITLDDVSFTTKIAIHSGAGVLAPFGCVALLDTGSPQTFIRRDVLDRMLSVGAASIACEQKCIPRSWGGFGESAPLQTPMSVRLSDRLKKKLVPAKRQKVLSRRRHLLVKITESRTLCIPGQVCLLLSRHSYSR